MGDRTSHSFEWWVLWIEYNFIMLTKELRNKKYFITLFLSKINRLSESKDF